jgi:hypothetical protein
MSKFYYEAIQVNVNETGSYSLGSSGSVDTYGYIYKDKFDPYNPFENLLMKDDDNCGPTQFKLITYLQSSTTYILVVTTFSAKKTGAFSIFVSGPNKISLKHVSKYLYYLKNNQHRFTERRKCLYTQFSFSIHKRA